MNTATQLDQRGPVVSATLKTVLCLAAWSGILTGLIEGAVFLFLQQMGWLSWNMALSGVTLPIIWIAALFDWILFSLVGLGIIAVSRALSRLFPARMFSALQGIRIWVFIFALLMFFDWGSLSGRFSPWGVFWVAVGLAAVFTRWEARYEEPATRFWQRSVAWVVGIALLASIGIQGGSWLFERLAIARLSTAAPGSPNILVIVIDTLRADHLSCYGYARPTSPNLDRIAQQGVLFENAISTAPWTLPSHVSLLTGRFVFEHRADLSPYEGEFPTIGEALQARGYRTAAFSANIDFFTRAWGFGQGFVHFEDYFDRLGDAAVRPFYGMNFGRRGLHHFGFEDVPGRKRAGDVNEAALRWLGQDQRSFFVVLNYFDIHDPYLPPQPYRGRFSTTTNPGGIVNGALGRIGRFSPPLTPAQVQSEMDAYDGGIVLIDDAIAGLFGELKRRGLAEDTIVVILSDHGEAFQDHGQMSHRNDVYREEIHVPLIFWWPGHLPEERHVVQPVSLASLPATLMELIGAKDQTVFPGPSLTQLWTASSIPHDWPDSLSELTLIGHHYKREDTLRSLVNSHWHFISSQKNAPELYDWNVDPHELHNLAGPPEGQQLVREFSERLQTLTAHRRSVP